MSLWRRLRDWWLLRYHLLDLYPLPPIAGGSWDSGFFGDTSLFGGQTASGQAHGFAAVPDVGGGALTPTGGARLTGVTLISSQTSIY